MFVHTLFIAAATFATPAAAKQSMFFASDIHDNPARLAELIDHAKTAQPIDFYGLVGDYGPGMNTTPSDYQAVLDVLSSERRAGAPYVLAEGNHDAFNRLYTHATGPVVATALPNNTTYNVYVINFHDFQDLATDISAVTGPLLTYLNGYADKKVLFILCHYPPHSSRGDVAAARALALFDTINAAAATKAIDIVLLWGHNHRRVSYDQGIEYIVKPGGTVGSNSSTIGEIASAKFNFAYVNAGYLYPVTGDNNQTIPPETLHSSVFTVTDSAVFIDRYRYAKTTENDVYGYHSESIALDRQEAYPRKAPVRALGDVNGDGQVNINDALLTARYSAGLPPAGFFVESADVDLNRRVDINDALSIARYSAGLLTTLPPPAGSAAPGVDGELTLEQAMQAVQNAMSP